MLERKKKEYNNNEKKNVHLFVYAQPFQTFQLSYHSMKCTDMTAKSGAVAGRDQSIHVSLTVWSQNIPNGK